MKRSAFVAASLILGILLALPVAEGLLRLAGFGPWQPYQSFANVPKMTTSDPELGWVNRPGRYAYTLSKNSTPIHINIGVDGSREALPTKTAAPTIWMMGGSFTQGFGVNTGQSLPAHLQKTWPAQGIKNHGVPGYGTLQSWQLYQRLKTSSPPPSAVIYSLIDFHDARNVGALSWLYALDRASLRNKWARAPYAHWDGYELSFSPPKAYKHWALSEDFATVNLAERGTLALSDMTTKAKTETTIQLIQRWSDETRADGSSFSVVLLHAEEAGATYLTRLKEMGISVVDLRGEGYPTTDYKIPLDGHPNGAAYALWANRLQTVWPEGPPLQPRIQPQRKVATLGPFPMPSRNVMNILGLIVLALYYLAAGAVGLYALSQLHLLKRSAIALKSQRPLAPLPPDKDLPILTIQLPIYNERRVVRALLHAIAKLDWPRDRLEIQVLDDSSDETVAIAAGVCEALRKEGLDIIHLQRPDRVGYKAGALAWALPKAKGDYIAIFDADFRPHPDFLRRAYAVLFTHPSWGLVQARWGHLNRDESILTAAQAFHLDAHFGIEQVARSQPPLMMGFNGTAGLWRRACIEAAGGWSADTLTEDLDLAFRAQLAGWQLGYLDSLEAPAELPTHVQAIRSQQHRWMKGGAQVGRKLITQLWKAELPTLTKIQGSVHLGAGLIFGAVLLLCLLTPIIGPAMAHIPWLGFYLFPAGLLLQVSLGILLLFYWVSCKRRETNRRLALGRFLSTFPLFMSLSSGLSLHNAIAVLEGWMGHDSPFIRTPKRGDMNAEGLLYQAEPVGWKAWAELLLAIWGAMGLIWALQNGQYVLSIFLAAQCLGFGAVALASFIKVR